MIATALFTKKYLPMLLLLSQSSFAVSAFAQDTPPAPTAPVAQTPPPASEPTPAPEPTVPANPKPHGFQIPKVGVDVGIFLPSSGKTRSRFSNSWSDIGFGIGRPSKPSGGGRISFDFSTQYKKSGDNHAFIAPVGISYRRALNAADVTNGKTFIPYYGAAADLVIVDIHSVEDDVHSRFRLSEGGSVVLGTTIGASGFVEGKYTGVAKVQGFDLSGFKLSAGIRF